MKLITTTIVLFFMLSFQAQEFSGKAIYKTSRKSSFKIGGKNNANISDKMKKNLEARLKKMNQKTFILQFDKFSSIYKEDVALSAPSQQLGGGIKVMSFGSGGSDIYYKNLKEKRFSNKKENQKSVLLATDFYKEALFVDLTIFIKKQKIALLNYNQSSEVVYNVMNQSFLSYKSNLNYNQNTYNFPQKNVSKYSFCSIKG